MPSSGKERYAGNGGQQDVFLKTWTDSYAEVSKMWEDSYLKLHQPWIETTGELFEKAAELSKEERPEKYEEFFEEWIKAYQHNIGKFSPVPAVESNKETLEKLIDGAEETVALYKSWIENLETNAKKTREVLKAKPEPGKYQERYDAWIKSYEKIFDELLAMSSMEKTKSILEQYTGVPDIYFGSFIQIAKLWRDSYSKLYEPWTDAASKLSRKTAELSQGEPGPEAFKEFYSLWMDSYKETYGKYLKSMHPTKESFDSFSHSTDIYLNMYRSWITALEKMAEKTNQISEQAADPEVSREFYVLWIKMYEKAFGAFFEDMPMEGPMKEMMEPVKMMAKINADTFTRMSKMWIQKDMDSAGRSKNG